MVPVPLTTPPHSCLELLSISSVAPEAMLIRPP